MQYNALEHYLQSLDRDEIEKVISEYYAVCQMNVERLMQRIKKLLDCVEQFNKGEINTDTYVELSLKADLPFHQKLIQFRSVHCIMRQTIHKE